MKSHSMLVMYYAASTVKYDDHNVREVSNRSPQIQSSFVWKCLYWHW
jgi:hypothetical protein